MHVEAFALPMEFIFLTRSKKKKIKKKEKKTIQVDTLFFWGTPV